MPLIMSRREYGVPLRLSNGNQIILLPNQSVEVSNEDLSSFGVKMALEAHHVAVISGGSPQKNSVKTEQVKTEKVETEKVATEKVVAEKVETETSLNAENSKKSKEGKAS